MAIIALTGDFAVFVVILCIMFVVSVPDHASGVYPERAECPAFDTLDDALVCVCDIIDDIISDCVIRVYDDDTVIGQYRGRMQRVGVDYDNVDFGPVL